MPSIIDKDGRIYKESDPDYDKVRISIIDLQNRVSRIDGEDLQWPADTYEPTYTKPL
jgi:hypothetical protein